MACCMAMCHVPMLTPCERRRPCALCVVTRRWSVAVAGGRRRRCSCSRRRSPRNFTSRDVARSSLISCVMKLAQLRSRRRGHRVGESGLIRGFDGRCPAGGAGPRVVMKLVSRRGSSTRLSCESSTRWRRASKCRRLSVRPSVSVSVSLNLAWSSLSFNSWLSSRLVELDTQFTRGRVWLSCVYLLPVWSQT